MKWVILQQYLKLHFRLTLISAILFSLLGSYLAFFGRLNFVVVFNCMWKVKYLSEYICQKTITWFLAELNMIATVYVRLLWEREREMFDLTTHSTHFIYGYMASDIWLRTILIVRKETRSCHIGFSYRLAARVLLYAPSHRQDNTYHSLCCTSRGALAGTRNSSMGPPYEGSIRWPIAPWANALPLSYVQLPRPLCFTVHKCSMNIPTWSVYVC